MSAIYTYLYYFPIHAWTTILILSWLLYLAYRLLRESYEKKEIERNRAMAIFLLIAYSMLIMYLTFLGRRSMGYTQANYEIGWSYRRAFISGEKYLLQEILLNILLFLPLGSLCVLARKHFRLTISVLYGLALSCVIEYYQLILCRGTSEYDDIISNTLGTIIGSIIALIVVEGLKIWRKNRQKS